jgi:hypothetical protein
MTRVKPYSREEKDFCIDGTVEVFFHWELVERGQA